MHPKDLLAPVPRLQHGKDKTIQTLVKFLHRDARVVDLGCGMGKTMEALAPRCREIVGVDIDEELLGQGRARLNEHGNARFVHTGGSDLPGIADASVDFLYSIGCLMHVDERIAFRYLRELRRVLVPHGAARLQYLNLLCDEGVAEFVRVAELDDVTREFATPSEIEVLAAAAGLAVVDLRAESRFLHVSVVPAPAEEWIKRIAEGIEIVVAELSGAFDGLPGPGRLRAGIVSHFPHPIPLCLVGSIFQRSTGLAVHHFEANVCARPGGPVVLELTCDADEGLTLSVDGAQPEDLRAERLRRGAEGPMRLVAGLHPPAFPVNDETAKRFPNLFP